MATALVSKTSISQVRVLQRLRIKITLGISSNRLATRSDKAEVSVQIRDAQ